MGTKDNYNCTEITIYYDICFEKICDISAERDEHYELKHILYRRPLLGYKTPHYWCDDCFQKIIKGIKE